MQPQNYEKIPDPLANRLLADLAFTLKLPKTEVAKIAIAQLWCEVVGNDDG